MAVNLQWWTRLAGDVRAAGRGDIAVETPLLAVRDQLGFDCAALFARHAPVANVDYPADALAYLASTYSRTCPVHQLVVRRGLPMRIADVPVDLRETRTYHEVIAPNHFGEGVTLPLGDAGFLTLSSLHARPLDEHSLLALAMLAHDLAGMIDPGADGTAAEVVLWLSGDKLVARAGDPARSPLTAAELRLAARASTGRRDGVRLAHRALDGAWWWVRAVARPQGALVRMGRGPILGDLTSRELDVVGLVARGWSNERISQALGIAVRTVRSHVESAMAKLGCANRTALARTAVEHDLDSIDALRVAAGGGGGAG
ncbi:hypothetical protein GCM10022237_36350 [Nocardioides ginsengisoli]|uniref:Response regulator transcription factor n=1 Tax=Nocardioides ginsengisoli TaxID=363868 RepID=A0ABW3VUS3_9ACTN